MDLYSGCSTLLQTSDRAGNGAEEIIRSLVGRYVRREVERQRTGATPPYVVRMRKLPATVHILSTKTRIEGGTLRLIGELYNNTTKTVGSTKVTAKLYNASNVLLATRTAYADLSYLPVGARAPFRIVGSLPAGFHHAAYTISATPTTRLIGAPNPTTTTNGPNGSGQSGRRRDHQEPVYEDGHDAVGRGLALRRAQQHPGCRTGERGHEDAGRRAVHDVLGDVHPARARPEQGLRPGDGLPLSPRHLHEEGGAVRARPLDGDAPPLAASSSRAIVRPSPRPVGRPVAGSVALAVSAR